MKCATNKFDFDFYKSPCLLVLQEFEGNQDAETPVLTLFNTSTVARYIRINPQTWYQNGTEGDICLRAEVLGCATPGTGSQRRETVFVLMLLHCVTVTFNFPIQQIPIISMHGRRSRLDPKINWTSGTTTIRR